MMMISRCKRVFAWVESRRRLTRIDDKNHRGDKRNSALTKIIPLSCHTFFYLLLNEADDVLGRAPKKPD